MPILPSHKNALVYLEHCRVVMADDRLAFVRKESAVEKHFSLPYGNMTALMLGPGTSITQAAALHLAMTNVGLTFCGGGSVPIYLASMSEYRPTKYLQGWIRFWPNEAERLKVAKQFQRSRCEFIGKAYVAQKIQVDGYEDVASRYLVEIEIAQTNNELMAAEALYAKRLYRLFADRFGISFTRETRSGEKRTPNSNLDHGNYLAYGLAATALWVFGIPHSLPVNHGFTRRGALVFDVADIVKDGLVLPNAFISATEGETESQLRGRIIRAIEDTNALSWLLDDIATAVGEKTR